MRTRQRSGSAKPLHKSSIIFGRVDANGRPLDKADLNGRARFQSPQLFQLFQPFQPADREFRQFHQEFAAIGVEPEMQQPRRVGSEQPVRVLIAAIRNQAAAEIKRPSVFCANDFDAGGAAQDLAPANRRGQC